MKNYCIIPFLLVIDILCGVYQQLLYLCSHILQVVYGI